jgi:hypothetical protein
MEAKGESAVRTLVAAAALGLAGAALFRGVGIGANLAVWVFAAIGALVFCSNGLSRLSKVGLAVVGLAALGLGWHGSAHIVLADLIALVAGLGLATLGVRSFRLATANAWDLTGRLVGEALRSLGEGLASAKFVPWKGLSQSCAAQKNSAVLRGALIATPLVMLFGALFSRADAMFSKTVSDALSVDVSGLGEWAWLTLVFGLIGLAFVGAFAVPYARKPPMIGPPALKATKLGMTELSVVLCSLCGLFGLFVAIQFQYLFGGSAAVVDTTGLTYSEYARRGFFELVWVAGLALPLLVGAHAVSPQESRRDVLSFRFMATVLAGLIFVVMASAIVRMQLYVESYGLTPLRVSATAFMVWLALVFSWFLASLYRDGMRSFAVGALAAGLGVVALLNFSTPDRVTARYNVARAAAGRDLDSRLLSQLGSEAVPEVLAQWDKLDRADRDFLARELRSRYTASVDWRGQTVSGLLAARAVRAIGETSVGKAQSND